MLAEREQNTLESSRIFSLKGLSSYTKSMQSQEDVIFRLDYYNFYTDKSEKKVKYDTIMYAFWTARHADIQQTACNSNGFRLKLDRANGNIFCMMIKEGKRA